MATTQVRVTIDATDNASKVIKGVGSNISSFAKSISGDIKQAGLIMAGLSASILMVGKSAISIASDLEQNRIAFETMTGSAEEAGKLLEKLSDFAVRTPFDMPGVIAAGKQLMAMGSGINDVIPDLKMLGDVAAGLGVPLQRLIINFGQVRMQGKLTGRELRDFAIAGVPLIDQLAETLGVAKDQIAGMVSAGEIGFPDVKQAFIDMTSEGGKFNDLMERQSKSLQGIIANTKDELIRFAATVVGISKAGEIREGSIFAVLKDGAEKLLVALAAFTPKAVEFTEMLLQNKVALMAVGGALLGLFIAPLVIAVVLMGKAILIVGIVIATFAALGAAVALLGKAWSENFLGIQDIVAGFVERFKLGWQIIQTTVQTVTDWFTGTALPAISSFFEFVKNLVLYFVAVWQFGWAVIKTVVEAVVNWFLGWAGPIIESYFNFIKSVLNVLAQGFKLYWEYIKSVVKVVVDWFMTYVYPTLEKAFNSAKNVVKALWESFKEKFDWIKEKVESVINFVRDLIDKFKPKIKIELDLPDIVGAWRNLQEKARNVGVPGYQAGGTVPGPIGAPVPILAHAGEIVKPVGVGVGAGVGGGEINFYVNVGLYAGTETEKRNIARELYAALVQVAQSQNKTVQELMHG